MKFYVNQVDIPKEDRTPIHIDVPEGKDIRDIDVRYVGLFRGREWEGRGNFCGWYGGEYYKDTTLVAYGIQVVNRNALAMHGPFNGGFYDNVNKHYDEIGIGSIYWEKVIEANSVEEAVEIFKSQKWAEE